MSDEQKKEITLDMFDAWLKDDGPAALVLREYLVPVEGKDAVILPPTYATPEGMKKEDWTGYNLDRFEDGTSVCQIDSVGSQANRMEPIFKLGPCAKLVPQITIKAGDMEVNLLDAGHRAADAIVRFSDLADELKKAFEAYKASNAEPLAKLAPTSLVFGAWDSRDTQVKLPRIVRSVIRAYNVRPIHRSAQYTTIAGEILEGGEAEVTTKGPKAKLGLAHVPAPWTHGGVLVQGDIRREAIVNLVALRALKSHDDDSSQKLRRYILGLALVAFTAPQPPALREGCELVRDPNRAHSLEIVSTDGQRKPLQLTPQDALAFAQEAAKSFEVGPSSLVSFRADKAKEELAKSGEERKAARKGRGKKAAAQQDSQEE